MKKIILILVLAVFAIVPLMAQNSCSKYYPMKEGGAFQYTMYDKKGKVDGTTNYSITNVKTVGDETSATFHLDFSNAKGKKELDTEYDITCTGTGIKIDYMSLMPSQALSQYEDIDMEMNFSGTDIELPNNLSVGQELEDANVTMNMSMSGMNMEISVDIVNRKVEGRETITTNAGSFDCYQLSETIKSKTMGVNLEMTSKTWLSEGVGMIKNETFRKNGKSEGSTILTKYSN